jgi:hypothetical protein
MFNKRITILGILCLGTQLTAMNTTVKVIDHNKGESLAAEIQSDMLVSIFGATPRYTFFKEYMNLLDKNLEELDAFYLKDKRLRGLQNRQAIKQQMDSLKKTNPQASIADLFKNLTFDEQCTLFFIIGFDRKKLTNNVADLCTLAAKGGDSTGKNFCLEGVKGHLMIHAVLPIYFDDCTKDQPSAETLHAFLQACAHFYETLYKQVKDTPPIRVYIPPLAYFEQMLELTKQGEVSTETKIELLATLIKDELIIPVKQSLPMVCINQNVEEMQALMNRLIHDGVDPGHLQLSKLNMYDGLKETLSFTPYIIKVDETRKTKTDFQTSPLLSPEALGFIIERGAQ